MKSTMASSEKNLTDSDKLLEVVKNDDIETFTQLVQHAKSTATLQDLLQPLNNDDEMHLWMKLRTWVENNMQIALSAGQNVEQDGPDPEECKRIVKMFLAILQMVEAKITCDAVTICDDLLLAVILLHGILPSVHPSEATLKNKISKLCELWWSLDLDGKECLIKNAMFFLLEKSLSSRPLKKDIVRVWKIHPSLMHCFNKSVSEDEILRNLLKQCATSEVYLDVKEGRKFISYIMSLDQQSVAPLHRSITTTMDKWTDKEADLYAQIYMEAWKQSTGPVKKEIEEKGIQDLMYIAIHSPKKGPASADIMFKAVRYFHSQRAEAEVSLMLHELYGPILWRSLKVPNGFVRLNAATIFFDVFPLMNPNFTNEESEKHYEKHVEFLMDLLYDPFPDVRAAAVTGTFNILCRSWELMPNNVLSKIFKAFVEDLSYDESSKEVRLRVVKGFKSLLSNPLAHPTLKAMLPLLKDRFHDVSKYVRLGMCELLLKVKELKLMEFWNVVPVDDLLLRLESDEAYVTRRLVKLLHSSYMPTDVSPAMVLERCVGLIDKNRPASRVFFMNVHRFVPKNVFITFMLKVCAALYNFIKRCEAQNSSFEGTPDGKSSENKENRNRMICSEDGDDAGDDGEKDDPQEHPLSNPEIAHGLLDAVSIIWFSIKDQLEQPENKNWKKKLILTYEKAMPLFLRVFKDEEIAKTVDFLASFLPSSAASTLTGHCLSKLRKLPENSEQVYFSSTVRSLANHGRTAQVLEFILENLSPALKTTPRSSAKKRGRPQKVRFALDHVPKPLLACNMLSFVIGEIFSVDTFLVSHRAALKDIWMQLKVSKDLIETRVSNSGPLADLCTDAFLQKAFELYLRIGGLLHEQEGEAPVNAIEEASQLIPWAERVLITELDKSFNDEVGGDVTVREERTMLCVRSGEMKMLCVNLLDAMLSVFSAMVMVDRTNVDFCILLTDFAVSCIQKNHEKCAFEYVSEVMVGITRYFLDQMESPLSSTVPRIMVKLLEVLSFNIRHGSKDAPEEMKLFGLCLKDMLLVMEEHLDERISDFLAVLATLRIAILSELQHFIQKNPEDPLPQCVKDLPQLSAQIVSHLMKTHARISLFMQGFSEFLESDAVRVLPDYMTCLGLLRALSGEVENGGMKSELLKEPVTILKLVISRLTDEVGTGRICDSDMCDVSDDATFELQVNQAVSVLKEIENKIGLSSR